MNIFDLGLPLDFFKDEIKQLDTDSKIVISSLNESVEWKEWYSDRLKPMLDVLNQYNFKEKYFLVNDTWNLDKDIGIEVVSINYFAILTVYETLVKNQKTNHTWNSSLDKSLFLVGKINSLNRIGLFMKLKELGILNKVDYSLNYPVSEQIFNSSSEVYDYLISQKIVKNTNQSLSEFLNEHKNNLDNIEFVNNDETFAYKGFPYSEKLYTNTSLSIVSETNISTQWENEKPWFTEKTYRAIINKHPFICANIPNSLLHLKKYGFHTFEEYFKHSNYNENDFNHSLNQFAENIKYFKETFESKKEEINQKIEDNYKKLMELYNNFQNHKMFSTEKELEKLMNSIPW